ncbi:DUF72 domain-containing protein [Haloparvum sp. AD34]
MAEGSDAAGDGDDAGEIRVGTCGYQWYDPPEGWKEEYESKLHAYSADPAFDLVELNRTFYELPQVSTAERWRREVVDDFEFAVKGWQALTHEWASPTWNTHREGVEDDPDVDTDEVGSLQPNPTVREAWDRTKARADALDANVVLLQLPPSFGTDEATVDAMRELLSDVDREGLTIAWEPRGDWHDEPDHVAEVCADLDLVHVVDPLRDEPMSDHPTAYLRLHGLNDDRYDYAYDYSDAELRELRERVDELSESHETVYVLFNNDAMYENARRFQELLGA